MLGKKKTKANKTKQNKKIPAYLCGNTTVITTYEFHKSVFLTVKYPIIIINLKPYRPSCRKVRYFAKKFSAIFSKNNTIIYTIIIRLTHCILHLAGSTSIVCNNILTKSALNTENMLDDRERSEIIYRRILWTNAILLLTEATAGMYI